MLEKDHQLALCFGLTAKTKQLCLGLESGSADILELVTPTTAELLKWWFGDDMVLARGGLNFHTGQKQAILNAIVADEVMGQGQGQALCAGGFFGHTPQRRGLWKNKRKRYFPHIITDFDLKSAMRAGLVKSLVLDRRKEIGALPLEFKAERDEHGKPILSEGQRVMLRAGLKKLRKLETDFAGVDPTRHPKMLVVCEDTSVSPLVI